MLKSTSLHPIQKFPHYGHRVISSAAAEVLFYGHTHCWVRLLE